MGKAERIGLPMSILDDLCVCEQRAKILVEIGQGGETPSTRDGKEMHRQLNRIARLLKKSLESRHYNALEGPYIEGLEVSYPIRVGNLEFLMVGVPDIVTFVSSRDTFFVLEVEVATYSTAVKTVFLRQALYALSLYERYGFCTIPVLLVIPSLGEAKTYILFRGRDWENRIRHAIERLAKIVGGEVEPKPPRNPDICSSCPPRIRGLCPLWG